MVTVVNTCKDAVVCMKAIAVFAAIIGPLPRLCESVGTALLLVGDPAIAPRFVAPYGYVAPVLRGLCRLRNWSA